jgi:hypothetical protein
LLCLHNSSGKTLWLRLPWLLLFSLPAAAQTATPPVGELFASETTTNGPVLLAGSGMSVASGSQLSAGKAVATLRLTRGGEVRICPRSGLSVTAIPEHDELMLSLGASSAEINYPINDIADTLLTPDFKLMLAGPGVFHFAVGVNSRGDTCIKPLRGNSSGIIVSEAFGNAVYQVKPDEAVVFEGGKLNARVPLSGECGCPAPLPVQRAEVKEESPETAAGSRTAGPPPATAAPPPQPPEAVHMQVDAPLVFRADQPPPAYTIARVRFSSLPNAFLPQENVQATVLNQGKAAVSSKPKEKKGFFGRIKGFFASLFHK